MDHNHFLKGALIGGCIAGLAALFMAPKSGKQLRNQILDGYNTITESSREQFDNIKEKTQGLIDSMQGKTSTGKAHHEDHNAFLMGSLAGAVLGALAGLLLAPHSGNKLREKLGDEYEEIYDKAKGVIDRVQNGKKNFQHELEDWKDIFSHLVAKFSSNSSKKKNAGSYLNDIADWASLGLRLYHEVQNRR